jgi:hypothetical protein
LSLALLHTHIQKNGARRAKSSCRVFSSNEIKDGLHARKRSYTDLFAAGLAQIDTSPPPNKWLRRWWVVKG